LDSLGLIHPLQDLFASLNHWLRPTKESGTFSRHWDPRLLIIGTTLPWQVEQKGKSPLDFDFQCEYKPWKCGLQA
jgi:hypothetical protein